MATKADPVNSKDEAFQTIYQELTDVRRRQAASDAQVQRIQKVIRLDEKEFAVGQMQSNRELIVTVGNLTKTVAAFVETQRGTNRSGNSEPQEVYLAGKDRRAREVERNLGEIRKLSRMRQRLTPTCPCGKHHGIMFVDPASQAVVLDNMCPKAWWIKQSRLAFEEKRLAAFVESTPLDAYLGAYVK